MARNLKRDKESFLQYDLALDVKVTFFQMIVILQKNCNKKADLKLLNAWPFFGLLKVVQNQLSHHGVIFILENLKNQP